MWSHPSKNVNTILEFGILIVYQIMYINPCVYMSLSCLDKINAI